MKFYTLSDAVYVQHGKAADGRVKFQARIGMAPRHRTFSERNGLEPNPHHDLKVGPLFVSWWINRCGNDGLTDPERAEYARRYREGPGRLTITPEERAAGEAWLANKRKEARG